jgi:transcriptional regulator with XRE-family HTH domain
MPPQLGTFGSVIATERKKKGLNQKELAAKILKEDGQAITPQYLNDIEHDRRNPSSDHLVKQFSRVLGVDIITLYAAIGMLSEQDRKAVRKATPDQVGQAFVAFRKKLTGD